MKKMIVLFAVLTALLIVCSFVIVGVVVPGLIAPLKNQGWDVPIALVVALALAIMYLPKVIMGSNPLKRPIAGLQGFPI